MHSIRIIKRQRKKVIHLSEMILEPYGGRLFEGFSMGKAK